MMRIIVAALAASSVAATISYATVFFEPRFEYPSYTSEDYISGVLDGLIAYNSTMKHPLFCLKNARRSEVIFTLLAGLPLAGIPRDREVFIPDYILQTLQSKYKYKCVAYEQYSR